METELKIGDRVEIQVDKLSNPFWNLKGRITDIRQGDDDTLVSVMFDEETDDVDPAVEYEFLAEDITVLS